MADEFDRYFDKMNQMNKDSAKAQMEFQERMSSTAHQRETKDLIAAGLNPVLSANNGASSPAGAYANVDNSAASAKFARQNLEREMANQRTIAMMNNQNAMEIATKQLGVQYALGLLSNETALKQTQMDNENAFNIEKLKVDNPNSIAGVVAKFISSFYGEDSTAGLASSMGKEGMFDYVYNLAKRQFDKDHGWLFSARRVNDMQNAINREKAIVAQAKIQYNDAIRKGLSKSEAKDIYRKYLKDHGYYNTVLNGFGIGKFSD